MKVLSLFSGIGAFEKALDNLGIDYELVGFSEIDKYAVKSYCAIHNVDESMNLGDITKIDEKTLPKDIDLLTYGFPCQDISLAGKQKGLFNADGTQTRSGLFFEALRIIEETKPKVAIAENVKNLTSKKFKLQFEIVLKMLEAAGYNNYWQVLNAKDYGIPQNRERVFIVSIRKDIDTGFFQFPEGFPLELRLKDMLGSKVDEKYYLPDEKVKGLLLNKTVGEPFIVASRGRNPENLSDRTPGVPTVQRLEPNAQGICNTLTTVQKDNLVVEPKIKYLGNAAGKKTQGRSIYDVTGISPTLCAGMDHGNTMPYIMVQKDNYVVEPQLIQVAQMYGTEKEPNPQAGRIYSAEGISPTMDSCSGGNRMPKVLVREATKKGYAEAVEGDTINFEQPNSKTRRGRVGKQVAQTLTTSPQQGVVVNAAMRGRYGEGGKIEQHIEISNREVANAITTVQKDSLIAEQIVVDDSVKPSVAQNFEREKRDIATSTKEIYQCKCESGWQDNKIGILTSPTIRANNNNTFCLDNLTRIRKLIPKECFRLMGFDDEDFEKAAAVNSNTQLYKQAGNSIVVNVLEMLLKNVKPYLTTTTDRKEVEGKVE